MRNPLPHRATNSQPSASSPLDPKELLCGLTTNGEHTPGLSIVADAYYELDCLTGTLMGEQPEIDRICILTLLQGLSRRLGTGVELLRRELAPEELEQPEEAIAGS